MEQNTLFLKNTLREICESSNVFKQNSSYIQTKLLHNLENFDKTLREQGQSFDKITQLFHEQERISSRNKIYNGEAFLKLEKDVNELSELLMKIKISVDDLKTYKEKIDKTSKIGWEDISLLSKREEEVESQQVDQYKQSFV